MTGDGRGRRTWLQVVLVLLPEVRATLLAMASIWAVLVSTGAIERIWPTDAVTTAAVIDREPETAELVAVPVATSEPIIEGIGSALVVECKKKQGCDADDNDVRIIETFQDGTVVITEPGPSAPPGLMAVLPDPPPELEVGQEVIVVEQGQDATALLATAGVVVVLSIIAALVWRRLRKRGST